MADSPESIYRTRAEAFGSESAGLSQRFNRVANARLVAFVASGACLIWGVALNVAVALGLGLVLAAAFVGLVRYHRLLGARRDRVRGLRDVNTESIERLARRWDQLPTRHQPGPPALHPYASDLDVFGRASLLQLLDTTRTPMGQATLTHWLLHPAALETVHERQAGVAELAPGLEFRQELQVSGGPVDSLQLAPQPLLAWAESRPARRQNGLLWAARISPVLLGATAVAQATGWLSWPVWVVFLLVNIVIWQVRGQAAYATLSDIGVQEPGLRQYAAAFDVLSTATFNGPRLAALQAHGRSAAGQVHALERLVRRIIPRSALAYWVVQMLCLWDLHVLTALEDWQAAAGSDLRGWLDALGEIEALAALAALAHAHPDWAIPHIEPGASRLEARHAGHPLLATDTRVDNDISLGPPGTFLLVTGSNMAGKSTYLRTIGANIVLAQAGGPVCAREFRMPPLDLCTSMRVVDSLERGLSTFFAEVMRLKQVVDVVRLEGSDGRMVCYLLDEILQGTNSAERQIAVRRVLRFLLARRALGAVSTHDLALADLPEFGESAQLVHFQETLSASAQGPIMSFGYRLQPGLATSTNALRLVGMLGLDETSEGSEREP